ncbi:NADP-dependent fatty aldehyde dehydrogenase [Streptomyces sp. enrichment culture]|uniref:aldehyde dehydrogenase (NADP(+)) n=1 Tax=Streptomyces sp. enrichment culture TaxID=1795815 RepID=UPI003F56F39E
MNLRTDTTAEQILDRLADAQAAFEAGRDVPPRTRAAWLNTVADALTSHSDELIPLAQTETHLATARLQGELKRTVFQLRLFAEEITSGGHLDAIVDHADPDWGMGPRPDLRRMNIPLGVVGVFGASNFPFAFSVIGGDSASALAAGCAVVHKIHNGHRTLGERTAQIVTAALAAAGAPAGLFSTATGRTAGEALVDHPLVQAIGFTGSTSGGRALFDRAMARPAPIPFFGELGSLNPVFVTERAWAARRDSILHGCADAATGSMGQLCTKPGLVFVPRFPLTEVAAVLRTHLANLQPSPLLTPHLREGFDTALAAIVALPDVEVLLAGDDADAPRPTILHTTAEAIRKDPTLLQRELFGPATVLISYTNESELPELAGLLEGQLTATVHAEPDETPAALVDRLRTLAGRVIWNGWPTGVSVTHAQHHGGPYPATTAPATTSVGTAAISRFLRPVTYQSFPDPQLPPALQDDNPWGITRRVNGIHQSPVR